MGMQPRQLALLTAAIFLVITVALIALGVFLSRGSSGEVELPPFMIEAEKRLAEKREKIRKAEAEQVARENYDIDQTITALFSIEKGLVEAKSFQELTEFITREEVGQVAPDVAALKVKFFDIYKNLIDARDDYAKSQSVYTFAKGAVEDVFSVVGVNVIGMVSLNQEQARKVWKKRLSESKMERSMKLRLAAQEDEMMGFLQEYARVSAKYLKKWEALCAARDRAYLAIYEKDWNRAIQCAETAVKLAPSEKEARALLALALLERGGETDAHVAQDIADALLKDHKTLASGYVLRGIINAKNGKKEEAILDFDQAAAYYPKQQEEVVEKLNLYRKRDYLNRSKEGRTILKMYRAMMSGAGYFSPDFQSARLRLTELDKEGAKRKIFEHFFRRRLQGQWGQVLTDFKFCEDYLKTDLFEIFANDKIALRVEDASLLNAVFFSNKVNITLYNNSDRDLRNVTLLLCARFTDMFKGDYVTFTVGDSIAELKAGKSAKLERVDITDVTKDDLGKVKEFGDIIEYGAVMISDDFITWVPPVPATVVGGKTPKIDTENMKKNAVDILKRGMGKALEKFKKDMDAK